MRLHVLDLHQTNIWMGRPCTPLSFGPCTWTDCQVLALRLYSSSMQNAQLGLLKQIMQWSKMSWLHHAPGLAVSKLSAWLACPSSKLCSVAKGRGCQG